MSQPPADDDLRDAHLLAALRHAPDRDVTPPAHVSAAILGHARQAVRQAPKAHPPAWPGSLRAVFDRLWQPAPMAAFGTLAMATLIGVLWGGQDAPDATPSLRSVPAAAAPPPASAAASIAVTPVRARGGANRREGCDGGTDIEGDRGGAARPGDARTRRPRPRPERSAAATRGTRQIACRCGACGSARAQRGRPARDRCRHSGGSRAVGERQRRDRRRRDQRARTRALARCRAACSSRTTPRSAIGGRPWCARPRSAGSRPRRDRPRVPRRRR